MYQISLGAFLGWFDYSIENSDKSNHVAKRVDILIDYLTYHIYKNVSRGLFEEDKLTYKLMLTMQIKRTERPEVISPKMIDSLLRGAATLNPEDIPRKPFEWMTQQSWVEVVALSIQLEFFGDIKNTIEQNQQEWRKWYESENPEDLDIPKLEERLNSHPSGHFMRLLIIQVLRKDRFTLAVRMLVTDIMGKKYTDPESIQLEDIWGDASKFQPVILLLTPGADPTISLQELAKKKMVKINAVSMGEGQEKYARIAIKEGMETGNWALLQNCHLGLGFMNQIDTILDDAQKAEIANPKEQQVDEKYRTWITCEPHNDFPINLLQMSIKVTNEPPAGMKAGLHRSYTTAVDTERLQRVEVKEWRQLVFTICFLHSTVQERRKFGAIGWCIPYEFNGGDLEATLLFTEKHFFAAGNNLSWQTIQYMLCEVQYGGRITDDWDRILFNNFGDLWMTPHLLDEDFSFFEGHSFNYHIPDYESAEGYLEHIADYPSHDSPEIFGLHTNADLTYGTSEANRILQTINDTQPAVVGGTDGGKTKEEIVSEKCAELLEKTPESYNDAIVRDQVRKRSRSENEFVLGRKLEAGEKVDGFSIPLNVFLYQEVTRINGVINNVSRTFRDVILAINGDIIMTPELQNALNFIYDGKPPVSWYIDPSGAKMAWSAPSLPAWFDGLIERNNQLYKWLNETRPITYWMTGFFNPQGFLTAARQEMTRRHKAEKWALDDVTIKPDVTDYYDLRKIKEAPSEGFYIQGLFLQGASWEKSNKTLRESAARELFTPLPVLKITAIQTATANKIYSSGKYYDCPCYTMPSRTDLNYVFVVKLATEKEPTHWISRGVALLCSKD
jgi:dynein heavy chain